MLQRYNSGKEPAHRAVLLFVQELMHRAAFAYENVLMSGDAAVAYTVVKICYRPSGKNSRVLPITTPIFGTWQFSLHLHTIQHSTPTEN